MVKRRRVTSSSVIAVVRNCSSSARMVLFSTGASSRPTLLGQHRGPSRPARHTTHLRGSNGRERPGRGAKSSLE